MKSSDAKASKCRLKISSKISIILRLLRLCCYFTLMAKNLFIATEVKLLNLQIEAW